MPLNPSQYPYLQPQQQQHAPFIHDYTLTLRETNERREQQWEREQEQRRIQEARIAFQVHLDKMKGELAGDREVRRGWWWDWSRWRRRGGG